MNISKLQWPIGATASHENIGLSIAESLTWPQEKTKAFSGLRDCILGLTFGSHIQAGTLDIRASCGTEINMGMPLREGSYLDCASVGVGLSPPNGASCPDDGPMSNG